MGALGSYPPGSATLLSPTMSLESVLSRLGLDRPELRAWAMYDWAASAVQTTIMVAVFPIYFVKVAGAGLVASGASQRLATANTLALVVIAVLSPVLGAVSDYRGTKKRLLALFMVIGAAAILGMYWIGPGDLDLASALFMVSMIGVAGSFVFYEALLPHVAARAEIDREVALVRQVVREVLLDHVALVAAGDDEVADAEGRVVAHDVPEDGPAADRDHRLRNGVRLLRQPGAAASGENDDLHAWGFL